MKKLISLIFLFFLVLPRKLNAFLAVNERSFDCCCCFFPSVCMFTERFNYNVPNYLGVLMIELLTISGTAIDQGIAYVLMLVALVLTYLIHPLEASSYSFF